MQDLILEQMRNQRMREEILDVISDFVDIVNCEKIESDWMDMYIKHMVKQYDNGSYRMCMKLYGMAYHRMRETVEEKRNDKRSSYLYST